MLSSSDRKVRLLPAISRLRRRYGRSVGRSSLVARRSEIARCLVTPFLYSHDPPSRLFASNQQLSTSHYPPSTVHDPPTLQQLDQDECGILRPPQGSGLEQWAEAERLVERSRSRVGRI